MEAQIVKQISEVAKIKLSEEEIANLTRELDMLLSYFGSVQEIKIEAGEKSGYMHGISNTFREDEVREQDEETKEAIRSEFTKREDRILIAPKSLK